MLIYFYEQYFFEHAGKHLSLLDEVEKAHKAIEHTDEWINLAEKLDASYYADIDAEIAYIVQQHFRKFAAEDIDREYIKQLAPKFADYKDTVREKVNEYTVSFGYDDMDLIDRVVFVLWYVEYHEIWTPKEIVLNEMIELAKRYWDDRSSKLINGIGHKVLSGTN